ncbi:MAG: glycosyltransferase [Verrucomicrobiaceae bacterium]|nr:glycosyltransferase [Verrucomicrobiaceae bacterium]
MNVMLHCPLPPVQDWPSWLRHLLSERFSGRQQLLLARITRPLSPALLRHVTAYADAVLVPTELADMVKLPAEDLLVYASEEDLASRLPAFIQRRTECAQREVLWTDPDIIMRSPAMKPLVLNALKLVQERGWRIRLWCQQTTLPPEMFRTDLMPKTGLHWVFNLMCFAPQVTWRQFMWWLLRGRRPARLVHACGPGFVHADMTTVHFINWAWCKTLATRLLRPAVIPHILVSCYSALIELIYFRWFRPDLLLAVGRGVARGLQKIAGDTARVGVLPSSYDEQEFHPGRREVDRRKMRSHWGFRDDTYVLAFAAQGGYERKGFYILASALEALWEQGQRSFRVLLLGGSKDGIKRLQEDLAARFPHHTEWLMIAGWVESLAEAMAAADAFVFPSYFESFAAVEAEACALGLPLALTPHWGSEMVLRPGENGVSLPWDVPGIAAALLELRQRTSEWKSILPEATPLSQYGERLHQLYTEALAAKNHS